MVDGLDECAQRDSSWKPGTIDNRENFLSELKNSTTNTASRILVVSRDEIDIKYQLHPVMNDSIQRTLLEIKISKDDVHHDIALFSKATVDKKLPEKTPEFRNELAAYITEKCDSNFLWVKLQATGLRPGQNRKMLLEIVEDMPVDLQHVFMRSQEYISTRPHRERRRAEKLLRWVTFALRPLTVLEITEALAIKDDDDDDDNEQDCDALQTDLLPDAYDEDYVDDQILDLCSPFLKLRSTISDERLKLNTVHFVHFSVRQYFLTRLQTSQQSITNFISFSNHMDHNNQLAKKCLQSLNDRISWERVNSLNDKKQSQSFLDYAVGS